MPRVKDLQRPIFGDGIMVVYISTGGGYWTFTFAQEGVELETNVTFIVDMSLEETHPEGVYLAMVAT